jgi:UV DNA damage repair endonuclease
MEELPRGWKIPKFTKFGGETNESTVEHIARYLTDAGDIANNENLRMKFLPSSMKKKCLYLVYNVASKVHLYLESIRKGFP